MEFEPKTPVFVRAKPVHALDGADTMIGSQSYILSEKEKKYTLQAIMSSQTISY
jgi:hypothetical protein